MQSTIINDTNFNFPLAMSLHKEEQSKNKKLQQDLQNHASNERFGRLAFGNISVHTIDGKIIVPTSLQPQVIDPGVTRTINSISQLIYWKGMCGQVEDHVKTCDKFQCHKIVSKPNYGILFLVPALQNKKAL